MKLLVFEFYSIVLLKVLVPKYSELCSQTSLAIFAEVSLKIIKSKWVGSC